MKKSYSMTVVVGLLVLCMAASAFALEATAIREADGQAGGGSVPCPLSTSTDGDCANYFWANLCSGYIWVFSAWAADEAVGTRFGGASQPAVNASNTCKRVITYLRNTIPNYNQTIDVYLDNDPNGDGCPDGVIASDIAIDPGERWNCSDFGVCFQSDYAIVREVHDGGAAPSFVTDGPFTSVCDPNGTDNSYYYGVGTVACIDWRLLSPLGRGDNFLSWVIVDCGGCVNSTENTSWGAVKGLYQ